MQKYNINVNLVRTIEHLHDTAITWFTWAAAQENDLKQPFELGKAVFTHFFSLRRYVWAYLIVREYL